MVVIHDTIGGVPYSYHEDEPKGSKSKSATTLSKSKGSARRNHLAIGSEIRDDDKPDEDDQAEAENYLYECVHKEKYVIYDENIRGAGLESLKEFGSNEYQLVIKRLAREKWMGFGAEDLTNLDNENLGNIFMQTLFGGIPGPPKNFKLTFVADPKPVVPDTERPKILVSHTWDGTKLFGEFVKENLLSLHVTKPNEWIVFRQFEKINVRDGRDIAYTLPWQIQNSVPSLTSPDSAELVTIYSGIDIINQLFPAERQIAKTIWAAVPRYGSVDWLKISGLWRMKTFDPLDDEDASDSLLHRYQFHRDFLWRIDDDCINLYPAGWSPGGTTYEQWHEALKDCKKGRYADMDSGSVLLVDFNDPERRERILQHGDPGFAEGSGLRKKDIVGLDKVASNRDPDDIAAWDLQKRHVPKRVEEAIDGEEAPSSDEEPTHNDKMTGKDPELEELELEYFQGPALATKSVVWNGSKKKPKWFRASEKALVLKPYEPAELDSAANSAPPSQRSTAPRGVQSTTKSDVAASSGQPQGAAAKPKKRSASQSRNSVDPNYSPRKTRSRQSSVAPDNGGGEQPGKTTSQHRAPSADAQGKGSTNNSQIGSRAGDKRKKPADASGSSQSSKKRNKKAPQTPKVKESGKPESDDSDGTNGNDGQPGRGRRNQKKPGFQPQLPTILGGDTPGDTPNTSQPHTRPQETPTVQKGPPRKPGLPALAIKPRSGLRNGNLQPGKTAPTTESSGHKKIAQSPVKHPLEAQLEQERAEKERAKQQQADSTSQPADLVRKQPSRASSKDPQTSPTKRPQQSPQKNASKVTQKQPSPSLAPQGKKRGLAPAIPFSSKSAAAPTKTKKQLEAEKLAARLDRAYPEQKKLKNEIEICSVCGVDVSRIHGPESKAEKRQTHLDGCETDTTVFCESDAAWKKRQEAEAAESGNDDDGNDGNDDDDEDEDEGGPPKKRQKKNDNNKAPPAKDTGKGRKEDNIVKLPGPGPASQPPSQKRGAQPSPDDANKRHKPDQHNSNDSQESQVSSRTRSRNKSETDVDETGQDDNNDDDDAWSGMEEDFDQALGEKDKNKPSVTPSPTRSEDFISDADETTPEADRRFAKEKKEFKENWRQERKKEKAGAAQAADPGGKARLRAKAEALERAAQLEKAEEAARRKAKAKAEAEARREAKREAEQKRLEVERKEARMRDRRDREEREAAEREAGQQRLEAEQREADEAAQREAEQREAQKAAKAKAEIDELFGESSDENDGPAPDGQGDEGNVEEREDDELPEDMEPPEEEKEFNWNEALDAEFPSSSNNQGDSDGPKQDAVGEDVDDVETLQQDPIEQPNTGPSYTPQSPILPPQDQEPTEVPRPPPPWVSPAPVVSPKRRVSPRLHDGAITVPIDLTGDSPPALRRKSPPKPAQPRKPIFPKRDWRVDQEEEYFTYEDNLPVEKRSKNWWTKGHWEMNPAYPERARERTHWGRMTTPERRATKAYLDERDHVDAEGNPIREWQEDQIEHYFFPQDHLPPEQWGNGWWVGGHWETNPAYPERRRERPRWKDMNTAERIEAAEYANNLADNDDWSIRPSQNPERSIPKHEKYTYKSPAQIEEEEKQQAAEEEKERIAAERRELEEWLQQRQLEQAAARARDRGQTTWTAPSPSHDVQPEALAGHKQRKAKEEAEKAKATADKRAATRARQEENKRRKKMGLSPILEGKPKANYEKRKAKADRDRRRAAGEDIPPSPPSPTPLSKAKPKSKSEKKAEKKAKEKEEKKVKEKAGKK